MSFPVVNDEAELLAAVNWQRFDRMLVFVGDGCLDWGGWRGPDGYGVLRIQSNGRSVNRRVHRLNYVRQHGAIPPGMVIDHLCRRRSCCNPDHLEVVTPRTNVVRGESPVGVNANKTHCIYGHELGGANLRLRGTKRVCLECRRRHRRESKQRQRMRR